MYGSRRDGAEALFLARADGTGETRLTSGDPVDRYPAWHDGAPVWVPATEVGR